MALNIFGPFGAGINPSYTRPADTGEPGSSDTWFQPCTNPNTNDGTGVSYRLMNKWLATFRRATRGMGVPDDPTSDDLLLEAIKRGATIRNIGEDGVAIYADQDAAKVHLVRKLLAGSNIAATLVEGPAGEHAIRLDVTGISGSVPYVEDTSGAANSVVADFTPAITAIVAGNLIEVKLANAVTGATTITVNGLSPVLIKRLDGTPLQLGDAVAGQILLLCFDGTNFQLLSQRPSTASPPSDSVLREHRAATASKIDIANNFSMAGGATPQITDGVQVLTKTITPLSSSSRFRVRFTGWFGSTTTVGSNYVAVGIYRTGVAAPIGMGFFFAGAAIGGEIICEGEDVPATASPVTYSARVLVDGYVGNSMSLNGRPSTTHYPGGSVATLTVTEVQS